jgi:thiamine biosynthesis lipoprotein
VNNNEPVEADEWFIEVFNKAQEISRNSNGAFDATAAPFFNVWGFGFSKTDSVSPAVIDSIKTFVGYEKVRLDGKTVIKEDSRTMLSFSAIAKGYACDVIARLLEREGVTNYMIDIGGEVVMNGVNPDSVCWRIGINTPEDDPTGTNKQVGKIVQPCRKCGIATSGNYRNYYIKDGVRYAHTINPATGYPAVQNILSATIIAETCMTADGYATAFMTMGVEKALEMAENIPEIEYYIIYSGEDGLVKTTYSDGMISYFPM